MSAALITLVCLGVYMAGFRLYAGFLARDVFGLRKDAITPATTLEDGVDYVPTNRWVLLGHHYASIAGLGPLLGPAIAVIWGWGPALVWVVCGALFVGCVHDFGALVLSMRAKGHSIGKVAEALIGKRAKSLFHVIIFFLVALAMGVFVKVIAALFAPSAGPNPVGHPEAVLPTGALMVMALFVGVLVYKKGMKLGPLTAVSFLLVLGTVALGLDADVMAWTGMADPLRAPSADQWSWVLLGYAFLASVLPVWLLLQPRDFVNSLLLYLGLFAMFLGFFVGQPEFVAPMYEPEPEGAPSIFPFVFITIACGAASGFHGLVSSGTTSKQIACETDARMIGYGAMIGESLLGLMAVLACTAGFEDFEAWSSHYHSWSAAKGLAAKINAFVAGSGMFISQLGVPLEVAKAFVALIVVSFALTSLDSGTRLLRYNIAEIGDTLGVKFLQGRYVASACAVGAIGFFCFFSVGNKPAGLALWALFGTTNQLLAALTLLAISIYLLQRGKNAWYTLLPMVFMMVSTLSAMVTQWSKFKHDGATVLLVICTALFGMALWLIVESVIAIRRYRRGDVAASLDIVFSEEGAQ